MSGERKLNRRRFLKTATTGGAFAGAGLLSQPRAARSVGTRQPNILFIVVDELRYPSVFPRGIHDVASFLKQFMPATYSLWQQGVKFSGHYTAGCACTPARGTLVTGLYTQQSWLLITILDSPTTKVSIQPPLEREYPTYGKLLLTAGYYTPYIGKWHLSVPDAQDTLEAYGFDDMTLPDPTGSNLQGTIGDPKDGYLSDDDIANQAAAWLKQRKPAEGPWCLTVGFVNPHDKEFFPAGTEFKTFTDLFNDPKLNPNKFTQFIDFTKGPPKYNWNKNPLKAPPPFDYPAVPPNWESADHIENTKPSLQTFARTFQEAVWGGVTDNPTATKFSVDLLPTDPSLPPLNPLIGIGKAPFSYWQRSLQSYTQIMSIVDQRIGEVINALPPAVADNTIIVLTSDHGEYAGAHGFVSGKAGSAYDEVCNVPLIVVDPSGRFTGDIDTIRTGLTSSVDILPMLVSLGFNGSQTWMTDMLAQIYDPEHRHNLLPMLKSANASGRPYVVFSTDEFTPSIYNFNKSPGHVIAVRTPTAKLGFYADWVKNTTNINFNGKLEFEFYDYSTPGGRAETDNTYNPNNPAVQKLYKQLVDDIIPHQLRAPLPDIFVTAQTDAQARYITYVDTIDDATTIEDLPVSIGDV